VITTDESPSGWRAKLTDAKSSKILSQTFGSWKPQMSAASSNKRKLVAVHKAIGTFLPIFEINQRLSIKTMTDNTTTAYNINRRAATHNLVPSTRKFLVMAENNGLQVKVDYIPGELNGTADSLSRLETAGDYSIQPRKFLNGLCYLQTTPNVDFFANKSNHLLSVYGSLKKDPKNPNSLGNALDVDWTNTCPFLHPPIPLINKVLEKFKAECKEGIIVVPDWTGQKWLIVLKELAVKRYILGQSSKVLIKGTKMEKKSTISEKPLCLPPGKLVMYRIKNPCLSTLSQNFLQC
jgi:hypothetical protein